MKKNENPLDTLEKALKLNKSVSELPGLYVNVLRMEKNKEKPVQSNKHDKIFLVGNGVPELFPCDKDVPVYHLKSIFNKTKIAVPRNMVLGKPKPSGNFLWLNHKSFPSSLPIPA